MLYMGIACAGSGILLDGRVKGLITKARAGTVLQLELNRADEVATVLLLFTLAVNAAAAATFGTWLVRAHRVRDARLWPVALGIFVIPIINPAVPFFARSLENGLTIAIAAKVAAVIIALLAIRSIRSATTAHGPIPPQTGSAEFA